MGKQNGSVDSLHWIETKKMADSMYVNVQSGLNLKKHLKAKNKKLKKKKRFSNEMQKDGSYTTVVSKRWDKSPSKRKKNSKLGSPVIVEDNIEECPMIKIPDALCYTPIKKSVTSTLHFPGSFSLVGKEIQDTKADKAEITIVNCMSDAPPERLDEAGEHSGRHRESHERSKQSCKSSAAGNKNASNQKILCSKDRESMLETETEEGVRLGHDKSFNESMVVETEVDAQYESRNIDEAKSKQLPRFYTLRNKVLAIVEPECKLCFHGKLRIHVLYGAVRIYGAHFNSSKMQAPVPVYSPRIHNPVAIEATECEAEDRNTDKLWESIREQYADCKFAKRLQQDVKNLEDGSAVVQMENFDNQLTNFLSVYCMHHLFPKVDDPSNHNWRDPRRAEIVLQANLRFADNSKQLSIDSRGIDDIADGICYDWETSSSSRTLIAGGKGVGKSTTVRYLVNKLLAKAKTVLILDLDPGQAEFTPAGCVSLNIVEEPLLGPNFTHLQTPHYQLYVGGPDVSRCLTHYIDAVRQLVKRILEDQKLRKLPLVVNTMGFCKGIGWEIINYVVKLVSPTDVIQILSRRWKNNYQDTLSRQVVDRQRLKWITWTNETANKPANHRLHVMYSEAESGTGNSESWNLESHQQRELVFLAYLSQIVKNESFASGSSQRSLAPSINAVAPYVAPFSTMSVSLEGAFVPQVLSIMNGNIVALCGINPEVVPTEESNERNDIGASYPRVLIRQPLSTCYGFGILRGVDIEKEQLFINTPLSAVDMQYVNCLAGCVNLPMSLLHLNQEGAPYTGGENDLPTSRGSRRGYYRMRYPVDS